MGGGGDSHLNINNALMGEEKLIESQLIALALCYRLKVTASAMTAESGAIIEGLTVRVPCHMTERTEGESNITVSNIRFL